MGAQAYLLLGFLICSVASAETIRFDGGKPGTLPSDWAVTMTHAGREPRWQIVSDPGAPSPPYVLAQLSQDRTRMVKIFKPSAAQ
jgi:hypothetical protein